MPAYLRGVDPTGGDDLLGMKWVAGFGANHAIGLPAINAVVILNDARTGIPTAILDGGPITALRTAAVSGVAIRHFAPAVTGRPVACRADRGRRPGPEPPGRARCDAAGRGADALRPAPGAGRGTGRRGTGDRGDRRGRRSAPDARDAVRDADVVVTAASFGPVRQVMTTDWLAPDALVVPVDYATYCAAEVARTAGLFLVDDRGQFLANRDAGAFDGYPDPTATIGEALLDGSARPATWTRRRHPPRCRTGGCGLRRRDPGSSGGARSRGRPGALTGRDG